MSRWSDSNSEEMVLDLKNATSGQLDHPYAPSWVAKNHKHFKESTQAQGLFQYLLTYEF